MLDSLLSLITIKRLRKCVCASGIYYATCTNIALTYCNKTNTDFILMNVYNQFTLHLLDMQFVSCTRISYCIAFLCCNIVYLKWILIPLPSSSWLSSYEGIVSMKLFQAIAFNESLCLLGIQTECHTPTAMLTQYASAHPLRQFIIHKWRERVKNMKIWFIRKAFEKRILL